MDDDQTIQIGPWTRASDGGLEAQGTVATAAGPPQQSVVRVDPTTVAEVGLAVDRVDAVQPELDRRARRALAHLITTGRVSPELRLSALDLEGVVGEDPPDDGVDQPGPEA